MATKTIMNFKRGDDNFHYFRLPLANWASGSTLSFAAKEQVDNDSTNALAVIKKSFTGSAIVAPTHEQYVDDSTTYELEFNPVDITNVTYSNGEKMKKYLGEFQLLYPGDDPVVSYPNDSNFIEVRIHGDILRN